MMVVAAIAILVGFSVLIWRSMPHEVDRSPGGHWTPEPTPSVPSAPAEPDADPDVETTVDAPVDGETDPDPLDEDMPYDGRSCWGCERRCTYRAFRLPDGGTRDEIHRIAERKYRAEHGCASDLDAVDGSDVGNYSPAADEVDFDPIAVARTVGASKRRAWFEQCEQCVDYLRRCRDDGTDPEASTVEPVAEVAAVECPF